MNAESIRKFCLALPHTTENVQWTDDLVFKVGGKMYAVVCLATPKPAQLSFKCELETFQELVEREGILPAPYLARAHWVALVSFDALPTAQLRALLTTAHQLVLASLPRKVRAELGAS